MAKFNLFGRSDDEVGTRLLIMVGISIVVVFFGGLIGWAAFAPLQSAAIAKGVAKVEGAHQTVQHLEGGIIRDIRVSEGQHVKKGDTLFILEDVQTRASLDSLVRQKVSATVTAMRHMAERDGYVFTALEPAHFKRLTGRLVDQAIRGSDALRASSFRSGQSQNDLLDYSSVYDNCFGHFGRTDADPEPIAQTIEDCRLSRDGLAVDFVSHQKRAGEAVVEQTALFDMRRRAFDDEQRIVRHRISQLEHRTKGLEGKIAAQNEELTLLREQLEALSPLVKEGLIQRTRIISLRRQEAQLVGSISENQGEIGVSESRILEMEAEIERMASVRQSEAATLFIRQLSEIDKLDAQITTADSVLRRRAIRAPVSGVVHELQYNTVGGVVLAGQKILDLVPQEKKVIIHAHLRPQDRDVVDVGMIAELKFAAAGKNRSKPIKGEVIAVSADRMTDPKTKKDYYLARVTFDEAALLESTGLDVHPGMEVGVMILTGKRTALDYIIAPIANAFRHALRES